MALEQAGKRVSVHGIVLALAFVDLLILAGNLVYLTVDEPGREPVHPVFSSPRWNGGLDGSWPEIAGQGQLAIAAAALLLLARVTAQGAPAVWALVVAWIVLDDSLQLHEQGGATLTAAGVPPLGPITPQMLGELAVWAIAGLAAAGLLLLTLARADAATRRDSWAFAGCLALLGAFATGVDLVGALAVTAPSLVQAALTLVETAGELAATTAFAAVALTALAAREVRASTERPATPTERAVVGG